MSQPRELPAVPAQLNLPDRPNLDQLSHQARDLLRAAGRGEPDAARRLEAVFRGRTLAAAQLVIAREHGFASWERLKAEVERRSAASGAMAPEELPKPDGRPTEYGIRQVSDAAELERVFDVVGAQMTPPMARDDRRFREVARRFEEDRSLMWLAAEGDEIVGGALGFRPNGGAITVRAVGVAPHVRRQGLGRRLMEAIELEAMKLGVGGINLGAVDEARGFYQRLGYAGRGSMMQKGLPLRSRFLEARLRKIGAAAPG